ncbi:ABC transporter ATP-binding protein [Gulosibacter molinativorax]|uniref:ABC transporter ATP-binding protein n=1 Tax=Gulosibacter molinativorax TaxID=256821 RepID=A0ABT7C879_9MICO|nr:ABC transporter ATP-binding protein [Gulosibacter molinativorax]MDJ1371389.1 ABC transporter ATP-binding protein [Gulosibacter molinativorax]QUY62887.1 Putative branched-chain amino acid ABC transporter [Gulosibacter molinativorax]
MTDNILEVKGISISLGGLQILDQVNLTAERGAITGVIGPNGAGKTTLFNIVSGFMKPTSGSVRFNGKEIIGRAPEQIAMEGLTRTFQKVRGLPKLTVRENVLVGALNRHLSVPAALEVAEPILERMSLGPYADAVAGALPIGLRKRLEVARVLATEPTLVLLDEVMGGLVPSEVQSMMNTIQELADEGMSVILIEHHMKAVMGLSRHVVVLERGRNLAEGTPAQVTKDPGVLTAYLGEGYEHVAS